MVPAQGFEPRLTVSKTAVLPLDDTGVEPSAGVEPASLVYETSAFATVLRRRSGPWDLHPYPRVGSPRTLLLRQARIKDWGDRGESNSLSLGSQPSALPLSYDHHGPPGRDRTAIGRLSGDRSSIELPAGVVPPGRIERPSPVCKTGALPLDEEGLVGEDGFARVAVIVQLAWRITAASTSARS